MRAAVYLRQSLDRQGNMLAISRQRDDCLKLCRERGWEPVEYVDNDTSATRSKRRPDYDRMLADVESGDIRAIVSWDLDRLYRRPIELEHLIDIADKHGLLLATITGDADLATDNGRLFARIKGAVAKAETERSAARRRAMAKQRAEAGENWSPRRPFGYTSDMQIDPTESAFVSSAYAAVIAGQSCQSIAKSWNSLGLTTTLGNQWVGGNIAIMLKRPRYAGLRTYRGEIVGTAAWDPIVAQDVWETAQAILKNPARNTRKGDRTRKHLLTAISSCGKCGAKMLSGKSPKKLLIYICRDCHGVTRSMVHLDDLIVSLVVARLSREDAKSLVLDEERPDLAELHSESAVLQARLDSLALSYAQGVITASQLRTGSDWARGQLSILESRMVDATRARVFDGVIGVADVAAAFEALDLSRKRAIIQALMEIRVLPTSKGRQFHPEHIAIDWR